MLLAASVALLIGGFSPHKHVQTKKKEGGVRDNDPGSPVELHPINLQPVGWFNKPFVLIYITNLL